MNIKLTAGTDVGLVRTNNEDNFVVCADLSASSWIIPQADETVSLGGFGSLLVVADGMGGANAGEVASAIAIETVKQQFTEAKLVDIVEDEADILKFITSVIKAADLNIVQAAKGNPDRSGMGTTIVMAWFLGTKAYIGWCGDSRCYVVNPKSGFTRLSKDHSYVQELVDSGQLTEEQAFDHPMSNVITRCLGDSENRAKPDTRVYEMHKGDIILLCSDGLCGYCHDHEIMDIVKEHENDNLDILRDALIAAALRAGGYDNVTVALGTLDGMEEADTTPTNELNATAPISHKSRKWLWWLLLLLLVVGLICLASRRPVGNTSLPSWLRGLIGLSPDTVQVDAAQIDSMQIDTTQVDTLKTDTASKAPVKNDTIIIPAPNPPVIEDTPNTPAAKTDSVS